MRLKFNSCAKFLIFFFFTKTHNCLQVYMCTTKSSSPITVKKAFIKGYAVGLSLEKCTHTHTYGRGFPILSTRFELRSFVALEVHIEQMTSQSALRHRLTDNLPTIELSHLDNDLTSMNCTYNTNNSQQSGKEEA
jgi:hypothetical protein